MKADVPPEHSRPYARLYGVTTKTTAMYGGHMFRFCLFSVPYRIYNSKIIELADLTTGMTSFTNQASVNYIYPHYFHLVMPCNSV